jgi:TatA/E family protein of Tat protein translocase
LVIIEEPHMFGIGMPEMILILAIALIVIGPKKLPDLAKSLGRAMREFKKATSELKESMELDNDFKGVKQTFDEVSGEIKGSLKETPAQKKTTPPPVKPKMADLEQTYEHWKQSRKSDGGDDEPSPSETSPASEPGASPSKAKGSTHNG